MVLFYFIQETGHYFGTRGHSFGTRRQIFETKFNYRTEGAVQRQSLVFYENRSGKSLKYDIISEHRDIISEQTTNFLKLTVIPKYKAPLRNCDYVFQNVLASLNPDRLSRDKNNLENVVIIAQRGFKIWNNL